VGQYLVVNGVHAGLYRFNAAYHRREAAFYQGVDCNTLLIALFPPGFLDPRDGPIRIYQLDAAPEGLRLFVFAAGR
jgi:hypothetical protein